MPKFGKASKARLATCDDRLQTILNSAIEIVDFTILEGHRTEERQNQMFHEGRSKLKWPSSKHNSSPSKAVDVAPYPIDWNDMPRFTYLAGIIRGIAHANGVKIRWGGDFNRDNNLSNDSFVDGPHLEIDED